MLSRRNAVQGAAGVLGALGIARPGAGPLMAAPAQMAVGGLVGSTTAGPPTDWAERHKRFNDAMKGPSRASRRRELTRALMEGMPPHLAGMRSNAPWFTAQRAAAFLEAEEYEQRSFLDRMRAEILGELF